MKRLPVGTIFVVCLLAADPVEAKSLYIQLVPATVDDHMRSFTIQADRFTDESKGDYLRFVVTVRAKDGAAPLSKVLSTELEVFDGKSVVASCRLQPTEREGAVSYSFLVASKYARDSKFSFGEILYGPNGELLNAANYRWFYVKDFAGS